LVKFASMRIRASRQKTSARSTAFFTPFLRASRCSDGRRHREQVRSDVDTRKSTICLRPSRLQRIIAWKTIAKVPRAPLDIAHVARQAAELAELREA
jgi:hypothetical protein